MSSAAVDVLYGESLVEAVALARGSEFLHPFPEGADPKHAVALLRLQARVEKAEES